MNMSVVAILYNDQGGLQDIHMGNNLVCSSILVFVPTISRADLERQALALQL